MSIEVVYKQKKCLVKSGKDTSSSLWKVNPTEKARSLETFAQMARVKPKFDSSEGLEESAIALFKEVL